MATGALGVDFRFLVLHQFGAAGSVHEMTGGAGYLILGVSGRDAAPRCALIQVATEAGAIHLARWQFGGVVNIVGRSRFGVFGTRAVAGLAAFLFPALAGAGFDGEMRSLLKVVVDFFVADL